MAEIITGQGHRILLDDEDYERFGHYTWHVDCGYLKWRNKRLHRLIMNPPPHLFVDHINGDPLDCRRANLRIATNQQNCRNSRPRGGSSKLKGAVFDRCHKGRKPWRSRIRVNGKLIHLGNFATEIEAAKAYDKAALEMFGEFARPNFND
jgi:hypothetical protein